jgi:hypothetical protein
MIVRAILDRPEIADNFDHFNDHRDTLFWLRCQPMTEARQEAMRRLQAAAIAKGCDPESGFPAPTKSG